MLKPAIGFGRFGAKLKGSSRPVAVSQLVEMPQQNKPFRSAFEGR